MLQLDAPVATTITALVRGHFLLPVQDDDFFTVDLDMYFFSYKGIRYGLMNIFHADSRPLVHDVLIDLKTAKVAGKRLQR